MSSPFFISCVTHKCNPVLPRTVRLINEIYTQSHMLQCIGWIIQQIRNLCWIIDTTGLKNSLICNPSLRFTFEKNKKGPQKRLIQYKCMQFHRPICFVSSIRPLLLIDILRLRLLYRRRRGLYERCPVADNGKIMTVFDFRSCEDE